MGVGAPGRERPTLEQVALRAGVSRATASRVVNGSPTVAGTTVWLAGNATDGSALLGFDARTGAKRFRARLAGPSVVAPTIVGQRLYLGTYTANSSTGLYPILRYTG